MSSWEDFGRFQASLNQGRDVLPDNIRSTVATITANAKSDAEKIRLLYEYMQKNTRYISIQLGIGGWQPLTPRMWLPKGMAIARRCPII